MRLGAQPAKLVAEAKPIMHTVPNRSRNGIVIVMNSTIIYASSSKRTGSVFSGTSPDGQLVEIIELPSHPWFLAVQFHPEFKSKPTEIASLFAGFVEAAIARRTRRKSRNAATMESKPS